MTKLKAELIYSTPLWVAEYAGRMSHNSMDKFNGDNPDKNADWIVKTGHEALLKHLDFHFELAMPRTILMEFEKHIIGVCSPNEPLADINQSTRYTLKKLIKLIEAYLKERDDMWSEASSNLMSFIINNVRDPEIADCYASNLIAKYNSGCTTPDTIKEALPESWMTKGVWKISGLALKNIIKQRFDGITGKPHFLIQELVGLMIDCLDDNHKKILGVKNV